MITILGKICDKLGLSFSFLNRDHSPSNKVVIKDSTVGKVQQAGRDINNVTITHNRQSNNRPQIDVEQWGGTGGPDGTSIEFYLNNIGSETGVDVHPELVADDLTDSIKLSEPISSIAPAKLSRGLQYRYDGTDFFNRVLKNPRIVFRYKSANGRSFMSGRNVVQESRADGRFNIHTKAPITYFDGIVSP